ncbi:hypothetical protein Ahy_B08g091336 [Arachis hypogaea]|uniref:Uncharacterized protein n=1 Tax=Arachis hypogaea TaxID=3818 RepID=A0A444Y245_ARAHY|nr:hypothetical protein Ahy_B08g091336 [Arachis hypogaea]
MGGGGGGREKENRGEGEGRRGKGRPHRCTTALLHWRHHLRAAHRFCSSFLSATVLLLPSASALASVSAFDSVSASVFGSGSGSASFFCFCFLHLNNLESDYWYFVGVREKGGSGGGSASGSAFWERREKGIFCLIETSEKAKKSAFETRKEIALYWRRLVDGKRVGAC